MSESERKFLAANLNRPNRELAAILKLSKGQIECRLRSYGLRRTQTQRASAYAHGSRHYGWKGGLSLDRYQWTKAQRAKNPLAYRAHAAVQRAIKSGKLVRKPCEVCGTTEDVHAHHDDYTKKLTVRWLCRTHHWHVDYLRRTFSSAGERSGNEADRLTELCPPKANL